jgi:hypothetical protein
MFRNNPLKSIWHISCYSNQVPLYLFYSQVFRKPVVDRFSDLNLSLFMKANADAVSGTSLALSLSL